MKIPLTMVELLRQNIKKHINLSERELGSFCNLFLPAIVKKKRFLLEPGEICTFEGFVIKGLFRVYHIDADGFDQVLYFATENWWITDIDSFYQCITFTTLHTSPGRQRGAFNIERGQGICLHPFT